MGELIINGIRVAFFLAIALVFMSAITTLVNLITSVIFDNVIGEVFGLISCFLPFNGASVFSGIGTVISAILAFLIAQKIYDLALASPLGVS